jgi:sulfide dehydrogenase cytochrome subunit
MPSANLRSLYRNQRVLGVLLLFLSAGGHAAPAILGACKACHDEDGTGVGKAYVPIIAGIPAAHIEEALYAYKDGARECVVEPVMCATAKLLSDDDIAELAEHYGALERYSHAATFNEDLAARGAAIHERLCARCHVPPDDPDVADALGFPLHGQRGDYLRYALESYLNGNRENLLPQMGEKIGELTEGDIAALVDYYISY